MPFPDALGMIMTGMPIDAKKAKKTGLVDELVPKDKDLVDAACEFALEKNGKVRPISKIPPPKANKIMAHGGGLDMALLQASKAARGMIAPESIVKAVRAALFSETFQEGVDVELGEFLHLVMSKESAGLRNIFFSERSALKVIGAPKDLTPLPLKKVGIIG